MSAGSLSTVDRSTLRERVLDALRTAITSGRYRPGEHLGEVELAGHLGVSRGTVREALRHLQQEGLVTSGTRGMLRVNQLSDVEVRELFKVRAALEALAVTEIMSSPHPATAAAELRRALGELAAQRADFATRVEADLGFHLLLCQLAGNSMLVDAWRGLEGRIRVAIMSGEPTGSPSLMMSGDRHAGIVEAIESGDVGAAVAVVHEHMSVAAEHFAGDPTS